MSSILALCRGAIVAMWISSTDAAALLGITPSILRSRTRRAGTTFVRRRRVRDLGGGVIARKVRRRWRYRLLLAWERTR